jgi:hypothetical protein
VSDGEGRSPDWAAILSRAHRRIYVRVVVVAAVAAGATVLLTSASVVNRAAVVRGEHHEPDLVILAKVRGVPGEHGQFFVRNDSSTNAKAFRVVVRTSTGRGRSRQYRFARLAAHRRTRKKRFACPARNRVTLKIRSRQIGEPDSESLACPKRHTHPDHPDHRTRRRRRQKTNEKNNHDEKPSCDDPKSFDSIKQYEEECPPKATGPDNGGEGGETSTGESSAKG